MTTHIREELYQLPAGENLSTSDLRYKVVSVAGTISASAVRSLGILKFGASSGNACGIVYEGLTKVFAGAAISTVGWPLTVTTSGYVTAAASGGQTVGRTLAVAASGDLIPVMVDFTNPGVSVV